MREVPVFDRIAVPEPFLDSAHTHPEDLEPIGRQASTPEVRAAARERVARKTMIETARLSILRRGIAIHQSAGKLERHLKPANDNAQDWPLAKFLRTERRFAALMVAERYRKLHDAATTDVTLSGQAYGGELDNAHRLDLDESTGDLRDKGERGTRGKDKPDVTVMPGGAAPARKWNGDNVVNNRIDARQELAVLRGKMGMCLPFFEMAVIDRASLEEVGNLFGIKNQKGATGSGRALVDIGLDIAARHWRMDLSLDGRLTAAA